MSREPLAGIGSVKVKLGVLVAASVTVATLVASLGRAASVPLWLSLPVTVLLALAVTQLLAVGMTSPLRQMTAAARRMARGDYTARVADGSRDEVGELARAFNTMAGDLGDVDRRRRELVATVSHELRTPLAGLRAVLENLVDDVGAPGPEARHAALATALGQAERMSGLVEDLLDLARVDAGHAPLRPEAVDVAALLDACVAEAVTAAGPRGRAVTYAVDVDPVELTVRADPARLHQLVANLLDNAARHSPAGGTVRATAGPGPDGGLRLQVHDEGPGVPPAERDRVFEAFGTGSGGGTGLGLAVARWVVDLHGGAIRFVDPVGPTGARVQVDLPPAPTPSPSPTTPEATVSTPLPTRPVPGRDAPVRPPGVVDDLVGDFWPDDGVPARLRVLLASLGVGLLGAVVLPFRDHGIGAALVLLAAGGVVLGAAKHRRAPFTLASAALCALLAATVAVRDAEWIAFLCALTGAALCVIGVTRGRTLPAFVLAGLSWPLAGLRGLPWLGRTLARLTGLGQGAALLRTVVLSALGLLVFGALLTSADALLAEWVDALLPDLTVDTLVLRAFLTVAIGGAVLAAAYLALNPPRVDRGPRPARPVAHRFEWLAPVLVVVGVVAAFLVAQAAVVFGGHDYLRRTTGLTYAEYVHQGFGQLTVVTALTLVVVGVAARKAPRETVGDRAWLRVALGALCVETLVVVASALHRMDLYQEAYGYTRLRLLVDVFEGWLGVVVLAVLVGVVTLRGAGVARFALLSGVVALLGLAAVNPDAWIAERNLERYDATGRVDWTYLSELSDDAVPVLADLPADERACALPMFAPADDDWLEWNLGRARAADALDALGPRTYAAESSGGTTCS
ncbi:two-component system sensor histidine kinase BaeS [Nocardioides zeae]|uniref:Two-component system sensor histidine kinase BaeS n=1 Tax=Nocardioides zeae TaxID=1457234 RepID=A0ACC6ILI5_9ACTN|nr:DUF4153 domain-containing protein [Nocardioides zeae]MDR6211470.1 two-component system sensor histidine kinase BaeS [Nocardioides zeae]